MTSNEFIAREINRIWLNRTLEWYKLLRQGETLTVIRKMEKVRQAELPKK